VVKVEN